MGTPLVATMREPRQGGSASRRPRARRKPRRWSFVSWTSPARIDRPRGGGDAGARGRRRRAREQRRHRRGDALELTPEAADTGRCSRRTTGARSDDPGGLPAMRERRAGCIVNVTSIAGAVATPNQIAVLGVQAALAALSEALAHEVRPPLGSVWPSSSPASSRPPLSRTRRKAPRATTRPPPWSADRMRRKKFRQVSFAAGFRNPGQPETVAAAILRPSPPTGRACGYPSGRRCGRAWSPGAPASERRGVGRDGRRAERRGIQRPLQALLRDRAVEALRARRHRRAITRSCQARRKGPAAVRRPIDGGGVSGLRCRSHPSFDLARPGRSPR